MNLIINLCIEYILIVFVFFFNRKDENLNFKFKCGELSVVENNLVIEDIVVEGELNEDDFKVLYK
jgi:hypothetical protein